ncbi:uncharacterized protein LOC116110540 [Pistacia vera]|uniref:uncharacterized protein LOC116110540 n=1 Tax=Pistacia vera TaxID=55513 RepID=UPI0012637AA4|nr:uncharacterized protein LOC116110540 [Pistacia vera]
MYSEFNKIFVLSMSNSEVFSVEFDALKRPSREFHDESDDDHDPELGQASLTRVVEAAADEKEENFNDTFVLSKEPVKSPELEGEFKATDQHHDENDDGFKTPTSLDHKIPVKAQCPPAPKKSNSFSSRKRRPVSSNVRRTLRLDLSHEVESLFPKPIFDDLHRKIKKVRKEN